MFIGRELAHHPDYTLPQKIYIRLLGAPIVGLRIRARNIFSLIPKERTYREILDAGSGTGVFTFELARRFPEANVLGIDLLQSAVECAEFIRRRAGVPNARFRAADLARPGVGKEIEKEVDLAVCVDILEHIWDDDSALRALHRLIAKDGALVLHVPALHRRYPVWKKRLNFDVETHVRPGYELSDIRRKVEEAGFSILESGYTYGFLETHANNISYMITGARMRNRHLYALAFPFLNALSWLGARARPKELGAGIYVVAEKKDL
jgi:SAM-dependent methyltransferase